MKFLFVTWAGGGNSTPVLGLATRLTARGHTVKVAAPDDMRARFAAVGIDEEVFAFEAGAVLALIEREAPDVVIVDFMMPSWMSQAEASGRPWVALVHTLYDRIGAGILTAFTTLDAINDEREELGLRTVPRAATILDRASRVLVTAPAALDHARVTPPNTLHVGAILEEAGPDTGWQPPWPDRPLLVMSPGTTPGLNEERIIQTLLDAVAERAVHAVVNVGAHVDTSSLRVPDNARVMGYVRHAALLPHADAMVTHGGLGSILAALSHGLPIVCLPLDRDQPHNADRVAALRVGKQVSPKISAADLWSAVDAVLVDPSYRDAAAAFAREYDPAASVAIRALVGLS